MNLSEKDIKSLKTTSLVSGLFTLLVAVIMLTGYVQLQRIKPLENPVLVQLKEQFDRDPENKDLQEQIRSLDLIARKAFFTATWQVRAGSYLLLAGAIIFILSLWMLSSSGKPVPAFPGDQTDEPGSGTERRQWLLAPALLIFVVAIVASLLMRKELPSPQRVLTEEEVQMVTLAESVTQTATRQQTQSVTEQPATVTLQPGQNSPSEIIDLNRAEPSLASSQPKEATGLTGGKSEIQNLKSDVLPPGQSFPSFRGRGSRGFAEGSGYPLSWDGAAGKGVVWKVNIPKPGNNSPVIWGDKLFITGADAAGEEIYCYSVTDGRLLWQASPRNIPGAPATITETAEDTGLAAPTAAVNSDVVIAIYATGNLVCADHTGKILWSKNVGHPDNHYGHSSSLIIHDNIVIVQFDHNLSASVMAFNTLTGDKAWETKRNTKISWASPVIAPFNGREQVIMTSDPYIAGYDLNDGRELWRARGVSAEIGPSVAVNSTMVFAGNEFAKLLAVKPGAGDDPVWQDNELLPEVASPVATEDHLFVATSFGAVACYDTKTGEIIWEHDFDYGFYASPIIAENRVYLMDINGVMHVFPAKGEFELLASSPLGEKSVCTPAFAHGRIFIRGSAHLYCIGKN